MNFGQFLAVLRARWKAAALVLLLTFLTTLLVSLVLPKQYEATASVVVDVKPDPIAGFTSGFASPAYMATQVDILSSDRVAQRVVRNLKLTEMAQIRDDWQASTNGQGSIEVWLAESLKKKLDVRPSRESNVVMVSYAAPDPRFAAGLANAWVQAYLETVLELKVDPARQYSSFFETRLKDARAELERAQTAVSEFQKAKGIIAADERFDVENSRLNELSSQLVALEAIASETTSRERQAQGASADKIQEVFNNPVVGGLRADIARIEAKLQELRSRLGEKHPQVVEMKASLDEMRSRLEVEIKRTTGGVTVSNNINRQREAQLRSELQVQRTKVLQMKQVRDEGMVLVRDVENAQRAYDAVFARLNQTSLESQSTQSNVNQLAIAVAPVEHASPRLLLNLVLSLVLGLLLAIGVALVLEMMDRRVRSRADLDQLLGLDVLGVIPSAASTTKRRALLGRTKPLALPAGSAA